MKPERNAAIEPQTEAAATALSEEDLLEITTLRKMITTHASGLEILSLHPRLLKDRAFAAIPGRKASGGYCRS